MLNLEQYVKERKVKKNQLKLIFVFTEKATYKGKMDVLQKESSGSNAFPFVACFKEKEH